MKKSRTTITEIARELNISPSTVSRSLNNHPAISAKTREAVIELARKLNYQPNLLALNLLRNRTNMIGVIVPEITSYFFSSVISGIQDLLNPLGVNMIIGQSNESYEEEKSIIRTFTSIRVDGFLISPSSETKNFDHLKILTESNIPLVIFDRDCEGIEVDKVFVDEYKGAFQAVEYLISTGCRRIAHIAGPPMLSTVKHRLSAYKEALKLHGLPVRDEYIVESVGFAPEHGIDPTKKLLALPNPPDAIFTINDGVAIGAMYVIKEAGIIIPDEISVIGFDDDPHSCYFMPSLSTVWQPTYELGMLSARILMKRVESNNDLSKIRVEKLFPELIIRGSSK
ncbi:MAG: LacI family transcriptional regulator [Bacteroidetes bacterium GWF2_42_66]|nr:MAG: LacI family transcriptional regulator [Bacteroidetes bacterium GWA2_42_15]OFY01313.1 MAG: LacI family transcriptional regulator [Bacteroidetes bacterium GWE2_42_39]OFY42157.1 MAG: LacI family transcriptional regulator [Bacteroidetes bacterium GWF2_42_66]HBL77636.1 LacI family transcriptional regulator [Prolixibacteraceae bacterium]HCB62765.1 LacI family transcriptional regulator [Bacteroidales bacterium]